MKITFIGAGNLATNLCQAAYDACHEIAEVYSRTEASASVLANMVNAPYTTDLSTVNTESDIYIVSVKDAVLEQVAAELSKRVGDRLIVHTAGSMPMDILPSCRRGVLSYADILPSEESRLLHHTLLPRSPVSRRFGTSAPVRCLHH